MQSRKYFDLLVVQSNTTLSGNSEAPSQSIHVSHQVIFLLKKSVALQLFNDLIGPLWVAALLFSGQVPLLTLCAYCFPTGCKPIR